jgi:hypothetical protein
MRPSRLNGPAGVAARSKRPDGEWTALKPM